MRIKKKTPLSAEQKRYRRRLRWKKFFLYLIWILSAIAVFNTAYSVFESTHEKRVNPQIDRAIVQIAKLLPQMEQNEEALRNAYDNMTKSWEQIQISDDFTFTGQIPYSEIDAAFEEVVDGTLSWLNRVTKLKVGRDGMVTVISKDDGTIVAHPDEKMVGTKLVIIGDGKGQNIIPIESINKSSESDDLDIHYTLMYPKGSGTSMLDHFVRAFAQGMYGGILAYGDYYILCGISATEFALNVFANALLFTLIYVVMMWLFVKWICLVMNTHQVPFKTFRNKLFSYMVLLCALFFGVTAYIQVLTSMTNDLKTMSKHADLAVETLNSYEEQRTKLGEFLDSFYLTQCRIAAALIENNKTEDLTWEDMQRYADVLQVKYIYLFDKDGKVIVTNSPYDRLTPSTDPEDFTYQFQRVLDGVGYLVMEPLHDEWRNEYIQYIAVNLRDENNLSNGFILIGVDPTLRDILLSPLNVDTVLENLVIGLPEAALAVDKETEKIVATTGIGYKGSSIEELGLKQNMLVNDFTGFMTINGTEYYAGVSTSSKYYLITLMRRPGYVGSIINSLKLMLVALVSSLLIILLTLIRYQRLVLDEVPKEELPSHEEPEKEEAPEEEAPRLLAGFSDIIGAQQEKKGLEDRWGIVVVKEHLTPEKRIGKYIYWILLLFCLLILLPTLRESLDNRIDPNNLSDLAYVISGNWQKGVNLFAFTTCVFLLCAMYVVVVIVNQILFRIAKLSDMRIETVCLLIKNAIKYICIIIFVYYGLSQFGVQTQTLLASAGILSMMISFGAKDLVSDIIAGFFTIIEGTYKVGDFITIGTWSGTVVEIGLRTTKVRSQAQTKILSNSSIREIINTDGAFTNAFLTVPISYEADLMEVETILDEELPKLIDVVPGLSKAPTYDGVDSLGESSVNLRISILVKTSSRLVALRRLTREIKLLFDRKGIEIPYNQLVLHNASEVEKKAVDEDKTQSDNHS